MDADLYVAAGLFDGTHGGLRRDTGLLVSGGRVVAVGPSADLRAPDVVEHVLDGVIVPGFVDCHTHITIRPGEGDQHGQLKRPTAWQTIRGVRNLEAMLRAGVTTAKIMSEEHDIDYFFRDAIAAGEVAGPRLLVAGPGLSPPGGHGSGGGGVRGVPELRRAVQDRAHRGADHIKIFTTGGVSSVNSTLTESNYSGAEIAAIVDEARAFGLTVSAHALGGPGVDLAVENGIHSIEHGTMLDAGSIERLVAADTWLVLTTTILFHPAGIEQGDGTVPEIMAKLRAAREYMVGNIGAVQAGGVRFALGTDSMHGLFGHEMQWVTEHGWSPFDALVAGTRHGGELIGEPGLGLLAPGSRADFAVLRGDPFDDIRAVHEVAQVYRGGVCVVAGEHVRPVSM